MCALGKASESNGKLKHPVLNSKVNHIKLKICQGKGDILGFRIVKGDYHVCQEHKTVSTGVKVTLLHLD